MKKIFFDSNQRLRNGWWILIFIGFVGLTRLAYRPITHGLKDLGVSESWLEPASFTFILLATWACTRLRKEPLSSVGFRLDRRWFREIVWGTFLGTASLLLAAGLIWVFGGVHFELNPTRNIGTVAYGFYMFLFVALFEETLFRGFIFQRLLDGTGIWFPQILLALLFAMGHWDNPGMQGSTKIFASFELALAAILLGLAYLRTRSLALPIGIHLGWNWSQGHILGFGVSGIEQIGWFKPFLENKPQWLTGGDFGPEASVFAVLSDLILIGVLWKWKGSVAASRSNRVIEVSGLVKAQ